METLRYFLIIFIFLLSANGLAQNLVPNGDFESLVNLPIKPNPKNSFQYEPLSGYKPYMYNIHSWFAATKSTPDLRITDLNDYRLCKKKFDDCNRSKSGIICGGIISYQNNVTFTTYREYLEVKLRQKLEVGKTINIELWVRKEREAKLVTNNIGCYFSKKKVFAEIEDQIKIQPQFNYSEIINQGETKWIKLATQLVVDQEYEYLTIGNFFNNENTIVEKYENYIGNAYIPPYAYYLVDDVKVWYEGTKPFEIKITRPVKKEVSLVKKVYTEEHIVENVMVEFDFNQSTLKGGHSLILDELLGKLKNSPSKYEIQVVGHADNVGSSSYNLELSTNRAKTVVDYFIGSGIQPQDVSFRGEGESEPLENNDTEINRRKNRRVEIRLNKI